VDGDDARGELADEVVAHSPYSRIASCFGTNSE
jgi:hypothetical protein